MKRNLISNILITTFLFTNTATVFADSSSVVPIRLPINEGEYLIIAADDYHQIVVDEYGKISSILKTDEDHTFTDWYGTDAKIISGDEPCIISVITSEQIGSSGLYLPKEETWTLESITPGLTPLGNGLYTDNRFFIGTEPAVLMDAYGNVIQKSENGGYQSKHDYIYSKSQLLDMDGNMLWNDGSRIHDILTEDLFIAENADDGIGCYNPNGEMLWKAPEGFAFLGEEGGYTSWQKYTDGLIISYDGSIQLSQPEFYEINPDIDSSGTKLQLLKVSPDGTKCILRTYKNSNARQHIYHLCDSNFQVLETFSDDTEWQLDMYYNANGTSFTGDDIYVWKQEDETMILRNLWNNQELEAEWPEGFEFRAADTHGPITYLEWFNYENGKTYAKSLINGEVVCTSDTEIVMTEVDHGIISIWYSVNLDERSQMFFTADGTYLAGDDGEDVMFANADFKLIRDDTKITAVGYDGTLYFQISEDNWNN